MASTPPELRVTHQPALKSYRSDIDGIRAIAVLGVVIYHIAVILPGGAINRLSGGFVGVDIFFVISGYLITAIISDDAQRGTFSIADFYRRRILRILPSLLVVVAVSGIYAAVYFFPKELSSFGVSAASALLCVSNVFFYMHTGYFDGTGDDKLLLHTWSLGVEEQFYVLWPLILCFALEFRSVWLKPIFWGLFAISLALSSWGAFDEPQATFYLPFARAWEFLCGSAIALRLVPTIRSRAVAEIVALIGLLAVLVPMFTYNQPMPFPGAAAIPPCFGTAALILAGQNHRLFVGRILSFRPVAFVGWISYSLYLWHWPILVLQKTVSVLPGGDAGKLVKLEVAAACFILATLTWRFVEAPFRKLRASTNVIFLGASAIVAACLVASFVLATGLSGRFSPQAVRMAAMLDYVHLHDGNDTCLLMPGQIASSAVFEGCSPSRPELPAVLLVGDSHAHHLLSGLASALPQINLIPATAAGCKLDPEDRTSSTCGSLMTYVRSLTGTTHARTVVIASRWAGQDVAATARLVRFFVQAGVKPIVFGPIVQYDQPLPRLLAEQINSGDDTIAAHHRLDLATLDQHLRQEVQTAGGTYISLENAMCHGHDCLMLTRDGMPIQYDYGHLTAEGSKELLTLLLQHGLLSALIPSPHESNAE